MSVPREYDPVALKSSSLGRRELRRLRYQNALFASILETTTDAVFAKDLRGRYTFINTAGASAFDLTREAVLGKTDWQLFDVHLAAAFVARDSAVLASGKTLVYEDHDDGERGRIWLSSRGVLRDEAGAVVGIFGMSRDITERKQLEREREIELAQRERMMSVLAHELSNPVLAIRFRIQRMLADPSTADVWGASLQQVGDCVDRVTRMVRDLMDFSRATQALGIPCRPRPTCLEEVFRFATAELEPVCGSDGVVLELSGRTDGYW
ncbi:MAG: PAS domain-containing protein, partial [Myxococcaceae bacterium]